VGGDGVGFVEVGLVSVLDEAAYTGLQAGDLNLIAVFL
jgi:hypothetical protein